MADRLSVLRSKVPSKRALLALGGGAAMVAAGIAQTTGTMAGSTDTSLAYVSQIASENFFPTPLTTSVTCTTVEPGTITTRRAQISWPAVPGATGYRLEIVKFSDNSVNQSYDLPAGTLSRNISDSDRIGHLYARVRTMNGPAVSFGYTVSNTGLSFKDWVSGRTECEQATSTNVANETWEDSSAWTPGSDNYQPPPPPVPPGFENRMFSTVDDLDEAELSVEEAAPSTSETSKPDASEAEAPETSTTPTTTEPTSVEPTTTESTGPKPESAESKLTESEPTESKPAESKPAESKPTETQSTAPTTAESGTTGTTETVGAAKQPTIAIEVAGEARRLLVYVDGQQVCSKSLANGDVPTVGDSKVFITNDLTVTEVNLDTCTDEA